jgi:hypothetical protein
VLGQAHYTDDHSRIETVFSVSLGQGQPPAINDDQDLLITELSIIPQKEIGPTEAQSGASLSK